MAAVPLEVLILSTPTQNVRDVGTIAFVTSQVDAETAAIASLKALVSSPELCEDNIVEEVQRLRVRQIK